MRIVSFVPTATTKIEYPFEGIQSFGKTQMHEGKIVGEYYGAATEEELPTWSGNWPLTKTEYKVALKSGEMMRLLGASAFAKINAAAYPTNGDPVDEDALFFMESAKYPYSDDGLIVVNISPVTDAMAYFVFKNYMTQEDADRAMQGQPYEVEL